MFKKRKCILFIVVMILLTNTTISLGGGVLQDSRGYKKLQIEEIQENHQIIGDLMEKEKKVIEKTKIENKQKSESIQIIQEKMEQDKIAEQERAKAEELARAEKIKASKEQGQVSRGGSRETFVATAYNLTPQSQGKWGSATASGLDLKGKTLSDKLVAGDNSLYPFGTKFELTFDDSFSHMNGVYTMVDTGGAIKGKRLDIFFGDANTTGQCYNFGRRNVQVKVIK